MMPFPRKIWSEEDDKILKQVRDRMPEGRWADVA